MNQVMLHDEAAASLALLLLLLLLVSGSQRRLTGTFRSEYEMLRLISGCTRRGLATISSTHPSTVTIPGRPKKTDTPFNCINTMPDKLQNIGYLCCVNNFSICY